MQNETDTPSLDDENQDVESRNSTCAECGKSYEKPILAKVISAEQTQEYYACPRCMTEVPETLNTIKEQSPTEKLKAKKTTTTPQEETVAGCTHYFGYLKKRGKDEPFPDECLSCTRMVDCLMR